MMFELQDAPARRECAGLGGRSWLARKRSINLPWWQAARPVAACAVWICAPTSSTTSNSSMRAAARCADPRRGAAKRRDRLSCAPISPPTAAHAALSSSQPQRAHGRGRRGV